MSRRSLLPRTLFSVLAAALLAAGCYHKNDYLPTAPASAGALALSTADGSLSLPADGVSRLTLIAKISADADADKRTVTFTTSTGGLVGASGSGLTLDVPADSQGRAVVALQSSMKVETAIVTASVKGAPSIAAQLQIAFTAPSPNDLLRFVAAPATAPADGATVSLFTVAVSPSVSTGTVAFSSSTGGTFSPNPAPIGLDHTATSGLVSPKTLGTATVVATLSTGGTGSGFSRQTLITFVPALPDAITLTVDNAAVPASGTVRLTAHLTRLTGVVTANTAVRWSARDASGNAVGTFVNQTVAQPAASNTEATATADYRPGAATAPGPITITAGTYPPSVTGSTTITVTAG